jgi:hypothetical protein
MMLALKRIDAKPEGKRLVDILEAELEKDPLGVLRAVAPWVPKELLADVDLSTSANIGQLPETAVWLAATLGEGEETSSEVASEERSVLPAALPPEQTRH